jgi:outer membrane receptor protein involved in Fe transport
MKNYTYVAVYQRIENEKLKNVNKKILNILLVQLLILSFVFSKTDPIITNNAKIIGIVINRETTTPIQYATVTLINNKSNEIISGQLTDIDGYFFLDNPIKGDYCIEVDFIGFISYIENSFIYNPDLSPILDLGIISIEPKALQLSEIKVGAERSLYNVTVDKKIYVIDQMKTTSGGTCCDVMNKVPSLSLGPNGEISLRGSQNVSVLINGKRAGILGDERKVCAVAVPVPASMIDRVEIITSPSAEYDPDGMTGIVNIILKEENVSGYNGELSINVGNRNTLNLSSTLSYRKNKLNLFSKFGADILEQRRNGYRVTTNSTNVSDSLDSRNVKDDELYFINLGTKYDVSERMLFSSEAKFTQYYQNALDTTYSYEDDGNQNGTIQVDSQIDGFARVYNLGLYTNFLNDSKLTIELSYDDQKKNENRDVVNTVPTSTVESSEYQLNLSKLILKADYYHKLSDKLQYETGYKGRFNAHDKNYDIDNSTRIDEDIHALYGTVTFALTDKLQSKAGVRLEQVLSNIAYQTSATPIAKTPNNYDHVYPSAYLAYIISPYSNLKFAYSTRVTRPELKMLDPFPQNQSILIDTVGNPSLKPEFVDAFEISYTLTKDKYKTDLSLYHHNIKNAIQWYDDDNEITYKNSGQGSLNGIDIMLKVSPLAFWDFTFTGNYYSSKIQGSTEDDLNGNTSGGIIRGLSMFKMPNGGNLELSSAYQLPKKITTGMVWPDGKFTFDMAYQISLFDDKLKLTCKAINIFDSDIYEQNITSNNNEIQSYRKYDNRTFYITIQYKFGNI